MWLFSYLWGGNYIKKFEIVKEHKDFDNIIASGKYKKNKYFILYNKESSFDHPRFGIAVGKKVGNAVIRNKLKRQYRMLITNNKKLFSNNQDYIIIVKRSSLDTSFSNLNLELRRTLEK